MIKKLWLQGASINKAVVCGGRQKSGERMQERCRTVEEQTEERSLGKNSVGSKGFWQVEKGVFTKQNVNGKNLKCQGLL